MALKVFVWIILRLFSCFADLSMFIVIANRKWNKWVVAALEIMWNFLIYIVLRLIQFKHPLIWTVFASSWSWVVGFILLDVTTEAGEENCILDGENQGM